ncbi:2-oxoacid:acceptor oxidoreductase, delta subunit,pyruvate/2-ketoisovalerate [Moorella glycerini]|uniref:Pyruvate synthase subunit PorD n=1 Tax=Neomoorella stamsii TaxID=1266720 RepID=A0A9X7P7K3_9FIRM|nr:MULTISPECIES: 4Fe-4S binding protein [Moorella]PRR77598.1 Pyruvate synthase subunit PorD [Moorella stamsii]CEP69355.1 2-oxoacid:acceptor oxidoreductase, delta subunit,pyruvate/2-ketoisovalerate [Moorella glycerini]
MLAEGDLRKGPNLATPCLSTTTGSWRLVRPVLDPGRCNNCLNCWLFCPEGCFTRGESIVSLNLDFCKGCGICVAECPRQALALVEEGSNDARLLER